MDYRCVQCGQGIVIPQQGQGSLSCPSCGFIYHYAKNYLKYDGDILLYKQFRKRYLLNKVLNNNGLLSYSLLEEGSLSLSAREDVLNFKRYILSHVSQGKILDVGCGILELPGYLDFENKDGFEMYGIDPIDESSFGGMKITGCAEFMPFVDNFFDAVIFATSLDHVCSVNRTAIETHRVLSAGGKAIAWISDRRAPLFEILKNKQALLLNRVRLALGFKMEKLLPHPNCNVRINHFTIYPKYNVFYTPKGAVDPFHIDYKSPGVLIKLFKKYELKMLDMTTNNKNEIFLCFGKTNNSI